jgi:hypothetical protein
VQRLKASRLIRPEQVGQHGGIHYYKGQGGFMARDNNTYAKRQRETGKKHKAEEKRARRLKRKQDAKSIGDSSDGDRAEQAVMVRP